jgi:thiamine-phosphate pyrophosphorylase
MSKKRSRAARSEQKTDASQRTRRRPSSGILLYYITDRTQFAGDERQRWRAVVTRILHAARAGVDFIQLREKDMSTRDLEQLADDVVAAVREACADAHSHTRLLINSRVDVAIACGADGVHLRSGPEDLSVADARVVFQKAFQKAGVRRAIIGVSCHSAEEVATAASQRADLAVFAPVFEKPGGPGAGLDALREVCSRAGGTMPVLALGGVTLENATECLQAGAAGVAGIRLFQQGEVAETIARLRAVGAAFRRRG